MKRDVWVGKNPMKRYLERRDKNVQKKSQMGVLERKWIQTV